MLAGAKGEVKDGMKEMDDLRQRIAATEAQLASLKEDLAALEQKSNAAENVEGVYNGKGVTKTDRKWPLSLEEYKRYGRQMVVPQVGIQGTV